MEWYKTGYWIGRPNGVGIKYTLCRVINKEGKVICSLNLLTPSIYSYDIAGEYNTLYNLMRAQNPKVFKDIIE